MEIIGLLLISLPLFLQDLTSLFNFLLELYGRYFLHFYILKLLYILYLFINSVFSRMQKKLTLLKNNFYFFISFHFDKAHKNEKSVMYSFLTEEQNRWIEI